MRGCCTTRSNLTSCEAHLGVAEDIAGKNVEEAHDEDCYSTADDQPPEGQANVFLRCIFFVEVREQRVAEEDLSSTKHDKA